MKGIWLPELCPEHVLCVCLCPSRARRLLRVHHRVADRPDVELRGVHVRGAGAVGAGHREPDLRQSAVLRERQEQGARTMPSAASLHLDSRSAVLAVLAPPSPASSCHVWEVVRQVQRRVWGDLLLEVTDIRDRTRLVSACWGDAASFSYSCFPSSSSTLLTGFTVPPFVSLFYCLLKQSAHSALLRFSLAVTVRQPK